MRTSFLVLVGMLAAAPSVQVQIYPVEMVITLTEVDVRSGPTTEYYPTSKLKYGDRVVVLHESELQKGWLAITPPQGSFSWINEKFVMQINAREGVVTEAEAVILQGSSVWNNPPNVQAVKVPKGSIVAILEKGKVADGVTWLRIQPWPTEKRFIPGSAVQTRQFANNNNVNINGPIAASFSSNPIITQADQAFQAGNVEQAKQLYKDAAEKTNDYQQKIYCYNRLTSLSQSPWNPAQGPGHPAQMAQGNSWAVGQAASFSQTSPQAQTLTYPPSWSQVGVLRRATFDKDGQPTYVLEQRGKVLMYVMCAPGRTLRDYVGRTVALYGSINYRSNDFMRTHFMTATDVALYN